MKNNNSRIFVTAFSILFAGMLYFVLSHMHRQKKQDSAEQLRIAIFTPTTHLALEEIEQGFKESLQATSHHSLVFITFNANGNRTLLRAQAEEIVNGAYDLIFTIGATCTQTVVELNQKKGKETPCVFAGVDGPQFAQDMALANIFATGVYVQSDYQREIEILHALKPNIRNILLVYDPTHGTGLEKDKAAIEAAVKKFGTVLHSIEIYQTNEIQPKVAAILPAMDVVLVLTDNTVVAGIDALIVLCNRYGVTLLASDLASGKKGAALAYGITEYESGSGAAKKAHAILNDGKVPSELPVSAITHFLVRVNANTMQAQNVNIAPAALQQFEGEIVC